MRKIQQVGLTLRSLLEARSAGFERKVVQALTKLRQQCANDTVAFSDVWHQMQSIAQRHRFLRTHDGDGEAHTVYAGTSLFYADPELDNDETCLIHLYHVDPAIQRPQNVSDHWWEMHQSHPERYVMILIGPTPGGSERSDWHWWVNEDPKTWH